MEQCSGRSGDKGASENRDMLERHLGHQATLIAQQRSRELLNEIESKKSRATGNTPTTNNSVPKSSGAGAIVSAAGYVLTAAHVVVDAKNVTVVTVQGTRHAAVVRLDKSNDLAVLKIEGGTYAVLPVGPSRHIRLGQGRRKLSSLLPVGASQSRIGTRTEWVGAVLENGIQMGGHLIAA